MRAAWSGDRGDAMGAAITRAGSAKPNCPPLKNGNELQGQGYLVAVGSRTARFRRSHRKTIIVFLLILLLLLFLILSLSGMFTCHQKIRYMKYLPKYPLCLSKECLRSAANLILSMDDTADPCTDFYQYACGNWAQEHPRPDTYRSYDWFRDKQTKVYAIVRDFLGQNTTHARRPVQQAKDMFDACMDTATLDKLGLKPIFQILETLGLPPFPTYVNVSEDFDYSTYKFDWLETVIRIKTQMGMDVLIGFDLFTDPKNSSVYRLVMGSPETTNPFPSMHREKKRHYGRKGLRYKGKRDNKLDKTIIFNRDYYKSKENKDEDDEEKVEQIYKLFYAELIKLFIVESEGKKNPNIIEPELDTNVLLTANEYFTLDNDMYELESGNDTEVDDDDFFLNIPEYTVDEIQAHTDAIVEANNGTATLIWRKYLEGIFNISDVTLDFENDKILVSGEDLKYMSLMASLLAGTSPVSIELYIWVKVVEVMAVHTTSELRALFQRSYQELRRRSDSGPPPRSLQCAGAVNDMLGMAVAYAIADPHFLNVTKPKIHEMLDELKDALKKLVDKAEWMDSETRQATSKKIAQMKTLIGFPDWLFDEGRLEEYYLGIEVDPGKYLENMVNIIQVKIRNALNKFREGNNFTWATDPTEVNAYHTFQENTITVPLVMLQYPFYDLGLDALNYGSLGTVLGHEITHGFDNFGRQFDENGNLLPWWSNSTVAKFVNLTQCFVDQYSTFYVPELDEYVDGKKTLGENIADNGGVREALLAFHNHDHNVHARERLPGFEEMTNDQLFFLSYANLWCGVTTKDSLESDLEDEHSPQQFRARGSLQNMREFARAWRCGATTAMNPSKQCIIF